MISQNFDNSRMKENDTIYPFKCHLCNYITTKKNNLERHEKTTASEQQYTM